MATETLRPNAAGDITQFSPIGEATNWMNVDEESQDGSSTNNQSQAQSVKDLYNIEASGGSGTINHVTVYWWLNRWSIDSDKGYHGIKSGATEDWGDLTQYVSGFTEYSRQFNTDPNTSSPWAWAAVDALQVGVQTASADYGMQVTQVYVVVDYTLGGQAAVNVGVTVSASRALKLARESSVEVGVEATADRQCVYHRYGWRP